MSVPPALPPTGHDPVLLEEILEQLDPRPGQVIVDCTIGRGGHALAIAARMGRDGLLIGIDADPKNLQFAHDRLAPAVACQLRLFHANFAELTHVLNQAGQTQVDAILADLGVSTSQLFDSTYGLSFAQDMPLDMRLDPRIRRSAEDLVNTLREEDLSDLLYELAQERYARRIARKIVEARRLSPIKSTGHLSDVVRRAVPSRGGPPDRIDPATRTFLALRMAVNQEMENLAALLDQAPRHLRPGGRLAVISFQSMEDRAVKQAFRSGQREGLLKVLTKKPLSPGPSETARNPRSRSAKLRVAQRT